jgi:hypothetical protein
MKQILLCNWGALVMCLKRWLKFSIIAILSLFLVSCGNALTDWIIPVKGKELDGLTRNSDVKPLRTGINVDYCTKDTDSSAKIKTLFIIDRSASNRTIPTDQDRSRRYGGIQNYLAQNPPQGNQYFGIIEFFCGGYRNSGNGCRGGTPGGSGSELPDPKSQPNDEGGVYVPTIGNGTKFIQNLNGEFSQIIDTLKGTEDPTSSGTPYHKPIVEAYNLITQDIDNERKLWKDKVDAGLTNEPLPRVYYRIVMVTDGVMTDVGLDTAEEYLYKKVDDLVQIPSNAKYSDIAKDVRLSTAFYNISSVRQDLRSFAEQVLQEMSKRGKGLFISLINGEQINFKALLFSPTVYVDTIVAHLFVYNENVKWSFEHLDLVEDRDADRVPDIFEEENYPHCLGKKDCDGNGYSDGVELDKFHAICNLNSRGDCDLVFKNVESCELLDTELKLVDTDKDGLNDCEEILLGSDYKLFDTRGHDISDGLSFYAGVPFVKEEGQSGNNSKTSQKDLDSDLDGISNYDEILKSLPVEIPNNYFHSLKPTQYINLPLKIKSKPNSVCYTMSVVDLPVKSGSDLVSVELILKENTGGGRNYYKKVSKRLENGSVVFTTDDMKIN